MSKKRTKRVEPKKQQKKATIEKRRISPLGFVLALATLLGGIVAVVTLLPRVTATVSDPVDPTNPFSAIVTIENAGYIRLTSVEPLFGLRDMAFGDPRYPRTIDSSSKEKYAEIKSTGWHPSDLGLGKKISFGLNEIWGKQPHLLTANIAILVSMKSQSFTGNKKRLFHLPL
jgi:hypothetical protein